MEKLRSLPEAARGSALRQPNALSLREPMPLPLSLWAPDRALNWFNLRLKGVGGCDEPPSVQRRVASPGGLACGNDGACAVSDREDAGPQAPDSEAKRSHR